MNKWVKCSDRLPEYEVRVLVAEKDGWITIAYLNDGLDGDTSYWINENSICHDMNEFTHWIPLPEMPYEMD